MAKITGTCAICNRDTIELHRCEVCGAMVCSRCFSPDLRSCKKCLSKGLWVGEKEE